MSHKMIPVEYELKNCVLEFNPRYSNYLVVNGPSCYENLNTKQVDELINFLQSVRSQMTPLYNVDGKSYTQEDLTRLYLEIKDILRDINALPQ